MTETDEKVLCVTREWADEVVYCEIGPSHKLDSLLNQKTYRNRKTPNDDEPCAEDDDRFKQIIPYTVVVNKDGQILAYNRGSKGGEKRLASKWAIGFGGHINDQDATFEGGIHREICEELEGFDCIFHVPPCDPKDNGGKDAFLYGPIGFINDDSNKVGQHHTGVVYVLRADEVVPKENLEYSWIWPPDPCDDVPANTESWAVLALPMVRAWIEKVGA